MPLVCDNLHENIWLICTDSDKFPHLAMYLLVIFVSYFGCVAGIVRTSVIVTGVQVCSRIFMVWFITNSIRQVTFMINRNSVTFYNLSVFS